MKFSFLRLRRKQPGLHHLIEGVLQQLEGLAAGNIELIDPLKLCGIQALHAPGNGAGCLKKSGPLTMALMTTTTAPGAVLAVLPPPGWPEDAIYEEAKVPPYSLPDPLVCQDATPVIDAKTWREKAPAGTSWTFRERDLRQKRSSVAPPILKFVVPRAEDRRPSRQGDAPSHRRSL